MRGQAMIEFVALIGIGLAIVAVLTPTLFASIDESIDARHERSVREQFTRLRSEFLAAYVAYEGYGTIVPFDPPYRGVPMNLTVRGGFLIVESERASQTGRIPLTNGTLFVDDGTFRIERTAQAIEVS